MKRTWLWIVIAFVLGELACFTMDAKFVLCLASGLILVLLCCMKIKPVFFWMKRYKILVWLYMMSFFLGAWRLFLAYQPMEYQSGEICVKCSVTQIKMGISQVQVFSGDTLVMVQSDKMPQNLRVGHHILIKGKYQKVKGAKNPGEFDSYLYYKAMNIRRVVMAGEIQILAQKPNVMQAVYAIRQGGNTAIQKIFAGKTVGFLQAALFGDKMDLDTDLGENFRYMGVSHLLAISGLHVSILGLSLYHVLRKKLGLGFLSSGMLSGMSLWFYAVLVGNGVSVMRASIMLFLVFVADMLGRSYDMLCAASVSAFVILVYAPFQLFHAGFLLSYGAIFSICAFDICVSKFFNLQKNRKRFKYLTSLLVTCSIFFFTLPLVLYFNFGYSPYSLLFNLLFVPMMGFALYSGLSAIFLSFVHIGAAKVVGIPADAIISFMDRVTSWARTWPHSFVIIGRPALWQIALYYLGWAVLLFAAFRLKNPYRRRKGVILLLVGGICLIGCLRPVSFHTKIYFLDVGQGDGILIQTKTENILIDFGSSSKRNVGERILMPALLSLGIRRVHHVFLTHKDMDHVNGAARLLETAMIEVDNIYLSDFMRADVFEGMDGAQFEIRMNQSNLEKYGNVSNTVNRKELGDFWYSSGNLKNTLEKHREKIRIISAGFHLDLGDSSLYCLSPHPKRRYSNANEASLVLVFLQDAFCAMFMGDAGKEVEQYILQDYKEELKHIEVLKLGHHGSATASSLEFLSTIHPKYAIISYGENNRYNHPHQEVVNALDTLGLQRLETPYHGAIVIQSDGKRMRVRDYAGTK